MRDGCKLSLSNFVSQFVANLVQKCGLGYHGSDPTFDTDFSKILSTRNFIWWDLSHIPESKTENLFWPTLVGNVLQGHFCNIFSTRKMLFRVIWVILYDSYTFYIYIIQKTENLFLTKIGLVFTLKNRDPRHLSADASKNGVNRFLM